MFQLVTFFITSCWKWRPKRHIKRSKT